VESLKLRLNLGAMPMADRHNGTLLGDTSAVPQSTYEHEEMGEGAIIGRMPADRVGTLKAAGLRERLTKMLAALHIHQDKAASTAEGNKAAGLISQLEAQLEVVKSKQDDMEGHATAVLNTHKEDTAIHKAEELHAELERLKAGIASFTAEGATKEHEQGSVSEQTAQQQSRAAQTYLSRVNGMVEQLGGLQAQFSSTATLRVAAGHMLSQTTKEAAAVRGANGKNLATQLHRLSGLKSIAQASLEDGKQSLRVATRPHKTGCAKFSDTHATTCTQLGQEAHMRCRGLHGFGVQECCHSTIDEWRWGRTEYMELQAMHSSMIEESTSDGSASAIAAAQRRAKQQVAEHTVAKNRWRNSAAYKISVTALDACTGVSGTTTHVGASGLGSVDRDEPSANSTLADEEGKSTQDPEASARSIAQLGNVIKHSTEALQSDLQQADDVAKRVAKASDDMAKMGSITSFLRWAETQAASGFGDEHQHGPQEASVSTAVQMELLSRDAEWQRKETQRKMTELKQSAEATTASTVSIAKQLLTAKWDPSTPSTEPDAIPHEETEAHLAAVMHATYAAFLMAMHQWSDLLYTGIQKADTAAQRATVALRKCNGYKAKLLLYKESEVQEVITKARAVSAQLSEVTRGIQNTKSQAFEDGELYKQANAVIEHKLKQIKHVMESANKPGPDANTRSKMERNQKLDDMLNGLDKTLASTGGSEEAEALLEKEVNVGANRL